MRLLLQQRPLGADAAVLGAVAGGCKVHRLCALMLYVSGAVYVCVCACVCLCIYVPAPSCVAEHSTFLSFLCDGAPDGW